MKFFKKFTLFAIVSSFLALQALADSPVWKISKGKQHLYLGGTIHVLGKDDYPLPKEFDQAYEQSTKLVFEVDFAKLQDPQLAQKFLAMSLYNDGRNLKQVLKPQTFAALEKYLTSRGIPVEAMLNYKPGMLMMSLTMIELQRLGLAETGVDSAFNTRAIRDNKALGFFETAQQQIEFISTIGEGERADEVIAYTLRDMEQLPEMMRSMKEVWRKGDNQGLEKLALAPFKKDFPKVYQTLLVKRNNAWMPQIESLMKTPEIELVLVGAAHLVGEEGLLAQLKSKGYRIENL